MKKILVVLGFVMAFAALLSSVALATLADPKGI